MRALPRSGHRLRTALRELPSGVGLVSIALATAIGLLAVMGTLYYTGAASGTFNVNDEIYFTWNAHDISPLPVHITGFNAPAAFSGALLFAASSLALICAHERRSPLWAWLGIGALFAYMGIDEIAAIHERVDGWTGVPWELVYLPLVLAAGVLWLNVLRTLEAGRLARLLWIGAAAAWSLSQLFEVLEFHGSPDALSLTAVLILTEEVGEMIGSALFVLAILVLLRESRLLQTTAARSPARA